jgi:hypothetical protein
VQKKSADSHKTENSVCVKEEPGDKLINNGSELTRTYLSGVGHADNQT